MGGGVTIRIGTATSRQETKCVLFWTQVSCNPLYGGTHEMLVKYLRDCYNVQVTFVGRSIDDYRKAVRSNTKVRRNN